jgi:glyoxylase-like metal-dependent hydrolase (beta-lactamase superfamily II)
MTHPSWTFGASTLSRIIESEGPLLSPFELYAECTQDLLDKNKHWLIPRFQDAATGLLQISIQSFLIRQAGLTILVDACSGNHKDRKRPFFHQKDWPWLERLREAGAAPEDIDVVLCSHLHVDHVGWNTRLENGRWVPTFPNARYLIAKREWDHWNAAGAPAMVRAGDYMTDSVLPVFATGQAELIGDEHSVKSDIQIEPAPGHTPGLYMVRLASTEGDAVLCSDLMHHPLQIKHHDWSTKFCVDPVQARTTRANFLAQHADSRTLVFPAHFPTPTGCRIHKDGSAYRVAFDGERQIAW